MEPHVQRSDGFAVAVIVEGGLAVIALCLLWLFHLPVRDKFPTFAGQLVGAVVRGLLATLPMLAIFWLLVNSKWPTLGKLRDKWNG